jgi:hypothetical protein
MGIYQRGQIDGTLVCMDALRVNRELGASGSFDCHLGALWPFAG